MLTSSKVKKLPINMYTKFDADLDARSTAEFVEVFDQRATMFFLMLRPQSLEMTYNRESLYLVTNVLKEMMGMYSMSSWNIH